MPFHAAPTPLSSRAPQPGSNAHAADPLWCRLDEMLLSDPGSVVASDHDWNTVDALTKKHVVDIDKTVDAFFWEHDDGKIFRGVVDKQQARGWLASDLLGRPLLPAGTWRAEHGTARGVGLALADEAKRANAAAHAASEAAKRRAKRAKAEPATKAALAVAAKEAVLKAPAPSLTLPPLSRRGQPRSRRTPCAVAQAGAAATPSEWQTKYAELAAKRDAIYRAQGELDKRRCKLDEQESIVRQQINSLLR